MYQRPVPVRKEKEACKNQAYTGPLNTGSSCPAKSVCLSDTSQKAKTLDSHVPSLKRRKLGELTSIPGLLMRSEALG